MSRAFPILLVAIVMGFAMILGTLALIIPGIIIWLMFYVAIPVAVVERPGVFASLGRSRQLTRGNRWRLFGLALIYALISGVIQVVLGLVIVGLALSGGEPSPFAVAVNWISQAVGALLYSTFAAVTYFALREAKEGLDVNQLAAVFD